LPHQYFFVIGDVFFLYDDDSEDDDVVINDDDKSMGFISFTTVLEPYINHLTKIQLVLI